MIKIIIIERWIKLKLIALFSTSLFLIVWFSFLENFFDKKISIFIETGSLIVFILLMLLKNYKQTGNLQLSTQELKIVSKNKLEREINFKDYNSISIVIKRGIFVSRLINLLNSFMYISICIDTIEFILDDKILKFNILREDTENELKRQILMFKKLETVGIKTIITNKSYKDWYWMI